MSADWPNTWEELARAAVADMRRYINDELPHRRAVSLRAYEHIIKEMDKECTGPIGEDGTCPSCGESFWD